MILQIDVDGVLADFTVGFRAILGRIVTGLKEHTTLTKPEWHDLDATTDQNDRAWDVVKSSPFFWASLPVIPSGGEMFDLYSASKVHDLYFVTSRVGYKAKEQTESWLRKHSALMNPAVIVTSAKGQVAAAIGADHALEDNTANAVSISTISPKTQSWLVDRKYNQFDQARLGVKVRRVPTLGAWLKAVTV